jgi:predicted Fe-S protein YdhL (DUF1289 family)
VPKPPEPLMATAGDCESPCVHICLMDYAAGHCIGCFRTLDEITHWVAYSRTQQQDVLAACAHRRAAAEAAGHTH